MGVMLSQQELLLLLGAMSGLAVSNLQLGMEFHLGIEDMFQGRDQRMCLLRGSIQ